MKTCLSFNDAEEFFNRLKPDFLLMAPKIFPGEGRYSDTEQIRYGEISSLSEIVLDQKSDWSAREIYTPIRQRLFFFTENEIKEPDQPEQRPVLVFLRACDAHALKSTDQMYQDGIPDPYYQALRKRLRLVLLDCPTPFENCFCTTMGTSRFEDYDLAFKIDGDKVWLEGKSEEFALLLQGRPEADFTLESPAGPHPDAQAQLPPGPADVQIFEQDLWREYDVRCINCGRCNLVCPTCTCFTMQDIPYYDNPKNGERRRVWASCMVDGYTDMAGGHGFRSKNGDRIRFRVMHKISDFKKRFGFYMCVGCGRCTDVCPQYISFTELINKLNTAVRALEK